MGSVVIEDIGTATRYPHQSGMNEDLHDRGNRAERRPAPPTYRHTSSSAYPFASVHHAPAAAPQLNTQNVSSSFSAHFQPQPHRSSSTTSARTPVDNTHAASRAPPLSSAIGHNHTTWSSRQYAGENPSDALPSQAAPEVPDAPVVSPPSPQLLPTVRSSLHLSQSSSGSPTRIKVRSLSHIQSFASEEALTRAQYSGRRFDPKKLGSAQYEISEMPVTDIIEMVAGLLTKITATNDAQHQHDHLNRHIPSSEGTSAVSQQTASVLSFHGKNVPSITILSYLSRIHKYCPTTYEVFLSLLVYFDRMTNSINNGTLKSFKSAAKSAEVPILSPSSTTSFQAEVLRARQSLVSMEESARPGTTAAQTTNTSGSPTSIIDSDSEEEQMAHCFVVDSYNIHRLVIAGVTCASKFFSDVFYTNSRYAKVGGLPIHELNHLELQFLLLNNFRLSVPVEELEAYGSMLVEFYASEVVAQHMSQGTDSDDLYMQGGAE